MTESTSQAVSPLRPGFPRPSLRRQIPGVLSSGPESGYTVTSCFTSHLELHVVLSSLGVLVNLDALSLSPLLLGGNQLSPPRRRHGAQPRETSTGDLLLPPPKRWCLPPKDAPKATIYLAGGIFRILSTRKNGKNNRDQRSWKR